MTEQERQQVENVPFAISFSCVDMILHDSETIVFITKEKDNLLRLPGGMIDVTDLTPESAAFRELNEETGFNSDHAFDPVFLSSFLMYDKGRYDSGSSKHRLRTHLFDVDATMNIENLNLQAGDDASGLKYIKIEQLHDIAWVSKNVMAGHIPLLYFWLNYFKKNH